MQKQNSLQEKEPQIQELLSSNPEMSPQLMEKNMKIPLQMCQDGRNLLKEKKYLEASKSFSKSVMAFQYLLKNGALNNDQTKEIFTQIMIPTYSNLSLCYLKMENYQSVISFCNQILTHSNSNVKAKYRRGLANQMLKKYDEAIVDFTSAYQLDPQIKGDCEMHIWQCKVEIQKGKRRERKIAAAIISDIQDHRSTLSEIIENKVDPSQTKGNKWSKFINCLKQTLERSKKIFIRDNK